MEVCIAENGGELRSQSGPTPAIWLSIQHSSVLKIRSRNRSFFITGQVNIRSTAILLYTYKLVFVQEKIRERLSNNYYEAKRPHKWTVRCFGGIC